MVIQFNNKNGVKTDVVKQLICQTLDMIEYTGFVFDGISTRAKEQMAMVCLALANIKSTFQEATAGNYLTSKEIIKYWNEFLGDTMSTGSYDSVRDNAVKKLVDFRIVLSRAEQESLTKNSSTAGYTLADSFVSLMKLFDTDEKETALCLFIDEKNSLIDSISDKKSENENDTCHLIHQQIFYGAPGTGKSNKIKEEVDNLGKIHFRTTFHPDSDYSTFVGCYKPKSHKKNMLNGNGINETQLLSSFFDSNSSKYNKMNKARYLYEALVHTKDIRDLGLDAQMVADKLIAKGFTGGAYTTEATCMFNIFDWLKADGYIVENKITYEFTPQSFLKAYTEAWKHQATGDPVYLIIEEINRGNCAQIFGDIFQLLDRDPQGFSRYEISPDSDIQDYIGSLGLSISGIVNSEGKDVSAEIASGEILKLPDNLYIWATMNTSDQSLFPIDSAFKRRWEWKYIKIKEGKDENGKKLDWKVDVKMDEEGPLLPWWDFIKKINEIIASMTSSADKQLGYFFCCAKDGVIDEETFVSKVIFYLWNDVFKDYGFEDASLFRYTTKDEEGKDLDKDLTFPDFYDEEGEKVNTERLTDFVKKVMSWKKTNAEQD